MDPDISFAPLPAEAFRDSETESDWTFLDAPGEPPEASKFRHQQRGAVATWVYRSAAGLPLCVVARFELGDDDAPRKVVIPYCYGLREGRRGWHQKAPAEPRPLYGVDRLVTRPEAPVIVVEGEKAADAATALFPDLVAVTSQGGSSAAAKADWSTLQGRRVVIWPDNDLPGARYAEGVQRGLKAAGAAETRMVDVPKTWPIGWDVGDAPPDGVTLEKLRQMSLPPLEERAPLRFISPHTLQGREILEREWIVQDWLPCGAVTLFYGDGGVGKTLLAQQLMTSCATAKPWMGLAVTRCRSLAVFCEDDPLELHRRQDRINRALGVEFNDLDDMVWASGVGQDNALMRFHADGKPVRTEKFAAIRAEAIAFQARLIVIDTAADTFGGNENIRSEVRSFVGALNALAQEIDGAVLLNAHPSRFGLGKDGDLDGGSTAWSNTARSRWSLTRPKAEGDDPADTTERRLTRRKANYAGAGAELRLQWSDGALMPIVSATGFAAVARSADVEAVFLMLLAKCDAENRPLSDSRNAGNSAAKIFSQRPDRNGFGRQDFESAMQRLFATGRIKMEEYGRSSGRALPRRIVATEGRLDV